MFDDAYFKIGTFKYFDFPIIGSTSLHDEICIIILVDTHRTLHHNGTILIILELQIFVLILALPIQIDEI
mgnify:CR=1 FL=1